MAISLNGQSVLSVRHEIPVRLVPPGNELSDQTETLAEYAVTRPNYVAYTVGFAEAGTIE